MRHLTLLPATAKFLTVFLAAAAAPTAVRCQEASKPPAESAGQTADDSVRKLQKQILELQSMLEEMRNEILRSRKEAVELRQEYP